VYAAFEKPGIAIGSKKEESMTSASGLLSLPTISMAALFFGGLMKFGFLIGIIAIAGAWKVFTKAGQPGWAVLVPFYNAYVALKIVGRPGWWLLLFLIPLVNFVIGLVIAVDMAKSFGQSAGFGILMLFFLSPIGYLILGFGDAQYRGPAAAPPQTRAAAV
jgi:Family of unknown function (DUF5684)